MFRYEYPARGAILGFEVLLLSEKEVHKSGVGVEVVHLRLPPTLYDATRQVHFGFEGAFKGHFIDRYNHEVKYLSTTKGAIAIIKPEVGHCQVCSMSKEGVSYTSVVGGLSCECEDNNFHICKHVEAASSLCSRTTTIWMEATQSILANNLLYEVDKKKGIYKCPTLAAVCSNKSCRREFTIAILDLWCSCHDFA